MCDNSVLHGGVISLKIDNDVAKKCSPPSPTDSNSSSGACSSDSENSSDKSPVTIGFHGYSTSELSSMRKGQHDDDVRKKLETIAESRDHLLSRTHHRPQIVIICGSGLGELADQLTDTEIFHYKDIPNFLAGSGHAGMLVFGMLGGKSVVCMKGRVHAYEGHTMWQITFPIRVFAAMGIKFLLVTNASGGLNPSYSSGDLMIIKDHINLAGLAGLNPFVGLNDDRFGVRFCALSGSYDKRLRELAWNVGRDLNMTSFLREGVYVCQIGPAYETVAESRMMLTLGADAAGMSTVFEVSVGRHVGMRCLGLSLVTNSCLIEYDSERVAVSHEEVLESSRRRSEDLQRYVSAIIQALNVDDG